MVYHTRFIAYNWYGKTVVHNDGRMWHCYQAVLWCKIRTYQYVHNGSRPKVDIHYIRVEGKKHL